MLSPTGGQYYVNYTGTIDREKGIMRLEVVVNCSWYLLYPFCVRKLLAKQFNTGFSSLCIGEILQNLERLL